MKKLVMIGAGGFGREAVSFLKSKGGYEIAGFIDAQKNLKGTSVDGFPVLGTDRDLEGLFNSGITCAFIAIGNVQVRVQLYQQLETIGFDLVNIIHPSAVIAAGVSLGRGVIVYPNVTINTGCSIGNSVLINSNASLGHDIKVRDFVNINPGVSLGGNITIGDQAFLGIGCSVIENISIGSGSVIGGGALVCKNVKEGVTVMGVPARKIEK